MAIGFTDRELAVMNVLWDEGSATVHEALDILEEDYLYTSLLSVFQTLEDKGRVSHEREGRAYRYFPEIEREEAERSVLSYVMSNVFRGSPERLLSRLLEDEEISRREAEELRGLLDPEAED
jgi:predicted transcriptional regulator